MSARKIAKATVIALYCGLLALMFYFNLKMCAVILASAH